MPSLNRVQLIGHLGRDPEVRAIGTGTRIASFSLATSETWNDRATGERKEKTEWHKVTVWQENTVDFIDKYVRKGDLILVEGRIETRKWQDQSGQDRFSTEIHVRNYGGQVLSLEKSGNRSGGHAGGTGGYSGTGRLRERAADNGAGNGYDRDAGGHQRRDELDDEIPF